MQVASFLAQRCIVEAARKALARRLLTYVFAAIVGLLAGRIVSAAVVYKELGWTAMWAEIGSWGAPIHPDATVSTQHGSGTA